jgi:lauroyl/myristoyl acyltransferase
MMPYVGAFFPGLKDRLGPFGFHAIREVERQLRPTNLYSFLAPLAFSRVALERADHLPSFFERSTPLRTIREARIKYLLSRIVEFFPDRLATTKWQSRFRTSGVHHIQEARKNGRRVVLVSFHYGTYKLIPFWLRALGIPTVALIRGKSEERSSAKRMKDELSPFPQIPTVVYTGDQMREMVKLLSAGAVLFLAADREASKQIIVPIDHQWSFRMATGPFRLASHYDAELIPCCMIDEGHWHFRLEIGQPVPREYLASESMLMRAAEHLLQELLPHVLNHPEQSAGYLLDCFQRNVSSSVAEVH